MRFDVSSGDIILNHFKVVRLIGSGGGGAVYLCRDNGNNEYAVKLIYGDRKTAGLEFQALTRLSHPNIVNIHQAAIEDNQAYLVLEFVPGGMNLRDFLNLSGPPGSESRSHQLLKIIPQFLSALDYLHSRGVVHGDLKPQNILITEDGVVKITDFGLAHITSPSQKNTHRGVFAGTVQFASPEQCKGACPDIRSDLYSLGVVLYEGFTGFLPFEGSSFYEILLKHNEERVQPPSLLMPAIPKDIEQIIMLLLEKNPSDRIPSARDVLKAFSRKHCLDQSMLKSDESYHRLYPPAFVGRTQEILILTDVIQTSSRPVDRCEKLLVSAPKGTGKTRLIHQLEILKAWEGYLFLYINISEQQVRTYDDLLKEPLDRLLDYFDRCSSEVRSRIRQGVSPSLKMLTGWEVFTDPESAHTHFLVAIKKLVENITEYIPIVFIIDAAQQASQLVLDLAEQLYVVKGNFCQIALWDSDPSIETTSCGQKLKEEFISKRPELKLENLDEPLIAHLITSVLGTVDIPDRLISWVMKGSGGNPGCALEMLRAGLSSTALACIEGEWLFRPVSAHNLPSDSDERMRMRYASLDTSTQNTLQILVLAYPIDSLSVIHKILGLELSLFFHQIEILINSGFIEQRGDRIRFLQYNLAHTIDQNLSVSQKQKIYDQIIDTMTALEPTIDTDLLALFLSRSSQPHKALQYYINMIDNYQASGRFIEITEIQPSIVQIKPKTAENRRDLRKIWRQLGVAYRETGQLTLAQDSYTTLRDLAHNSKDHESEIHALYGLAGILYSKGKTQEALVHFKESTGICIQIGNKNLEARSRLGAGVCFSSTGNYKEALTEADLAGSIFSLLNLPNSLARSYQLTGDCYHALGRFAEAQIAQEKALHIFQAQKQSAQQASCLGSIGRTYLDRGYLREAENYFSKALELAGQYQHPSLENLLRINLGFCLIHKGEPYRAIRELEIAVDNLQKLGFPKGIADGFRNLALAHSMTGNPELAKKEYQTALEIYNQQQDISGELECLLSSVEFEIKAGRLSEALDLLLAIRRKARDAGDIPHGADVYEFSGSIFSILRETAKARRFLKSSLRLNKKLGRLQKTGMLQCHLGFTYLDVNCLNQAAALFESSINNLTICDIKCWLLRPMRGLYEISEIQRDTESSIHWTQRMSDLFKEVDYHSAIQHVFFRESPYGIKNPLGENGVQLADRVIKSGLFNQSLIYRFAQGWISSDTSAFEAVMNLQENQAVISDKPALHEFEITSAKDGLIEANARPNQPQKRSWKPMNVIDPGPIQFLLNSSKQIFSANDFERLLTLVIDQVVDASRAERAFLMMKEDTENMQFRISRNLNQEDILRPEFETSRSIIDHVIQSGKTFMSADVGSDQIFKDQRSIQMLGLRSMLCVPLISAQTPPKIFGLIYLDSSAQKNLFTGSDQLLVEIIASLTTIALGNIKERQQLTETNVALDEEVNKLKEELGKRYRLGSLVGRSNSMMKIFEMIERVARTPASILITGETGTGKEIVAKTIHFNSPRKDKAFVGINCAALPENLLESELFGIEKGVATGVDARVGLIQKASGGTLFLDEIADMAPSTQAKILRVLQEREVLPLGGRTPKKVDIRVISATNRNLKDEMKQNRFREDLFYRLNVISIHLPPIRERREDILPLAKHFLQKYAKESGSKIQGFSQDALNKMAQYEWPGNVRELENAIQYSVIMEPSTKITAGSFPPDIAAASVPVPVSIDDQNPFESMNLKENVDRIERILVEKALSISSGLKKDAARILGLTPRILSYYLKKHGLSLRSKTTRG